MRSYWQLFLCSVAALCGEAQAQTLDFSIEDLEVCSLDEEEFQFSFAIGHIAEVEGPDDPIIGFAIDIYGPLTAAPRDEQEGQFHYPADSQGACKNAAIPECAATCPKWTWVQTKGSETNFWPVTPECLDSGGVACVCGAKGKIKAKKGKKNDGAGAYTVVVTVDPNDEYVEFDEKNNVQIYTLYPEQPPCSPGACCLGDSTCTDGLTAFDCENLGGTYQGDNSLCPDIACPILGACKNLDDILCAMMTEADCAELGGIYAGDGSDCQFTDCDGNGMDDTIDLYYGTSADCNGNFAPDVCDLADGTSADCNASSVPDECEAANTVVEEFFDPGSEPFGWWFMGDADHDGDDGLGAARLVHSNVEFVAGVAALNDTGYTTDAFEVEFDFNITNPAGGVPDGSGFPDPDGLAFIVNCDPLTLGYNGYGLGYKGLPLASFAVEFDTFQNFVGNQPDDPDSNHVGLDVGGSVESIATAFVAPDFDKSGPWHARMRFMDGALAVWATPPGGAEMVVLTAAIPQANIPPVKYFGFGSGTGINSADTDVDNVVITLLDTDANLDGLLDECDSPENCPADVNGDGEINPLDSGAVLARLGCLVGAGDPLCDDADANGDGATDPLDVGFVLTRLGDACASEALVGMGIAFDGENDMGPATVVYMTSSENAGVLAEGDVILQYRGLDIGTGADLLAAIEALPPLTEGEVVDLVIVPFGTSDAVPVQAAASAATIPPDKWVVGEGCFTTKIPSGSGVGEKTKCSCLTEKDEMCTLTGDTEQRGCKDLDDECTGSAFNNG